MKAFDFKIPKKKNDPLLCYAFVRSSGKDKRKIYTVTKYRKDKTYRCTCPDNVFRLRKCKHIDAMINHELLSRIK